MNMLDKRIDKLWADLEDVVARLPTEESESKRERESEKLWLPGELYEVMVEELDEREQFSGEDYLYGRLFFQVCRRLKRYVEQQELGKVQDIWVDLAANLTYLEEPISSSLQERGESIIDQLQALTLQQEILAAKSTGRKADISEITLDLVDPLLLDMLTKHPELLKSLEWRTFEKLLARILEDLGYEIELQRGTKDGGVDVFALKRDSVFGAHRYLLQAKRWSNAVGVEPVRELLFLHGHHRITRSCLATTSRFTSGAWELAREYAWQLELKDFDKLMEWVELSRASAKRRGGPA